MVNLQGRVAIVAGASRGRGQGVAIELGAAGAFVYLFGRTLGAPDGRDPDTLNSTLAQIRALGGDGRAIACDCTDPQQAAQALAAVDEAHGRLDVLVNSVFSAPTFGEAIGKRIWETADSLWDQAADTPVRAAYFMIARAAPLLMKTASVGAPTLVVNISGRGSEAYRYNVAYGIGKSALARLTRDAATELRPHHVAVLDIWPNGYAKDPSRPETPRYSGRAVAALASDPDVLNRTGRTFWSAEIGAAYGFTDEFGHAHEVGVLVDQHSLQ